jgi:hypothetical protein
VLKLTYVGRILEKTVGDGVLESLEILVNLALVFEKHIAVD